MLLNHSNIAKIQENVCVEKWNNPKYYNIVEIYRL